MKFEMLTLADAANVGADGKLNVLGMGARILTLVELPGNAAITVIGSAAAMVDEAGEYPVAIYMETPDGGTETVLETVGTVSREVTDDRVPTGIGFMLDLGRTFTQEGVYRLRATIGDTEGTYDFVVQLRGATTGESKSVGTRKRRGRQNASAG